MTTTNHTSPSGEDDFVFKNHQRLLFLTADLEDADLRKARNDLLDRMPVMTYSAVCLQIDAILSERGLSLNPFGSSTARPISDVMMDLVDRLGHEWKDVDPRAWSRLLIYAPIGEDAANVAMGEREAFEAWWLSDVPEEHRVFAKKLLDGYGPDYTAAAGVADAWETWMARAALTAEKVAQAEPVAWLTRWPNGTCEIDMDKDRAFAEAAIYRTKPVPLYAAPPAQTPVALTDDARDAVRYRWLRDWQADSADFCCASLEIFLPVPARNEKEAPRKHSGCFDAAIDAAMTAAQPASGGDQ